MPVKHLTRTMDHDIKSDKMKRIIINNRSDCHMPHAIQMVIQSLDTKHEGCDFKDFLVDDKPYTLRIINNKLSKTFNIYNDK